jgi:hypothetical protein
MKTLFSIALMIFLATSAMASPFLVCDPSPGITEYVVTGPSWVQSPVPAQPDGSIRMDVVQSIPGDNALTISACSVDTTWGRYCSTPVPFTFNRPGTSNVTEPRGTKLVP